MVIGTICVNFVSISPLTDWLVSAFYFLFFFLSCFCFFILGERSCGFTFLLKTGAVIYSGWGLRESTGKEFIIGLGFILGFKKNKLAGTAVEPSNSILLHTKFSKMRKKIKSSIS